MLIKIIHRTLSEAQKYKANVQKLDLLTIGINKYIGMSSMKT
jgi:hypothetical protein